LRTDVDDGWDNTINASPSTKHPRNKIQRANQLLKHRPANNLRHIRHRVTTRVLITKITLDLADIGVQHAEADENQGSADGTDFVHACWDGQDACGEEDLQEDDGGARPGDGAEVDAIFGGLEDFELVVVRLDCFGGGGAVGGWADLFGVFGRHRGDLKPAGMCSCDFRRGTKLGELDSGAGGVPGEL
jgi:hypothetical protein